MNDQNWKNRTYLTGAILGALAGIGVAFVIVKRSEESGEEFQLGTREGLRLGLGILGLLREVSRLGSSEE